MTVLNKRLSEIARYLNASKAGPSDPVIRGVSGIKEAREGDITFLANRKYYNLLDETRASAVIVPEDIDISEGKNVIIHASPSLAFSKVVELIAPAPCTFKKGIHPAAVLGEGVTIGRNAAIHAYCVIEDGARIGDNTVLYPFVYVGKETKLGKNCLIYPHVTIRERIVIGDRVIVHSGTVIGSDGFGFAAVEGVHTKIPQIGNVIIENDVEIGANTTIDRARFNSTVIKKGTKIDNLVQIAHNVVLGEHSIVVAQSGVSGSTTIGDHVTIAGQAGVVGHITIGDHAVIAGRAGVTKDVEPKTMVSGFPAKPHIKAQKLQCYVQRLPRMNETLKNLADRVEKLERLAEKHGIDTEND